MLEQTDEIENRSMIFHQLHLNRLKAGRLIPKLLFVGLIALFVAACSGENESQATRTPVPTWTPTPGAVDPSAPTPTAQPEIASEAQTSTPTIVDTPTSAPVDTPVPTETPTQEAEATPTAEPTATAAFAFELEIAEKFPTDTLAPNMVRVFLFVTDATQLGLGGYRLLVMHDDKPLAVDSASTAGLPALTRDTPGPYSRFTNLNAVFVESQSGRWTIQLLDPNGAAVGPQTSFDLTADEITRELYVRYRLK